MADTTIFFPLVSHRFRLSDSSYVFIGSTRGIVRCRLMNPIGFAYRSQASMMLKFSIIPPVSVISVFAFLYEVLELKVIVECRSSEVNVISSRVLPPGAALMKFSSCSSSVFPSPWKAFMDTLYCVFFSLCATSLMNDLSEVASVKKRGFVEEQFVVAPCASWYGSIQFRLFILAIRLLSRASFHLTYLSLAPLNIFSIPYVRRMPQLQLRRDKRK